MNNKVIARAPVRIADVGGWTDTWFAGAGMVCNLAVSPGAHAVVETGDQAGSVTLTVGATGETYSFVAGDIPGRHPLLEAAVSAIRPQVETTIEVGADVPPGSGLGTSAAVTVALLAALAAATDLELGPAELAAMAHDVETVLGWQSGVQDQWAAAFGGASELTVDYPNVTRRAIAVDGETIGELNRRMMTIYLGAPRSSSTVHEEVITALAMANPAPTFRRLREAAEDASRALALGDMHRYGAAMVEHHSAIRELHPGLISQRADNVIAIARASGALGWKLNGAGGDGGTITVLGPALPHAMSALRQSIEALSQCRVLDLWYSPSGVTTTTTEGGPEG